MSTKPGTFTLMLTGAEAATLRDAVQDLEQELQRARVVPPLMRAVARLALVMARIWLALDADYLASLPKHGDLPARGPHADG
jgi:hypothetical protein